MRTRISLRTLCLLAVGAAIGHIAGSASLHAQRWQYTYGNGQCYDVGDRGVTGVSTGGYIAAGSSKGTSLNCTATNAYVVRTDDNGALMWSQTYNIGGGNSAATCIRECANGDFIVTGTCQNLNACCCNADDVFLLRIDASGTVLWVKSYGSTGVEAAYSVIEATLGNGMPAVAGDFIVCGSSLNGTAMRGYVFRTSAGGNLIWDRTYPGPTNQSAVYYDLDEALTNQPGTILVAGQALNGPPRGTILRLNGNDGTLIAGPITFGVGTTTAYSIKELQVTNAGDIVITGSMTTAGQKVFIARFGPNLNCGAAVAAARYYNGGNTAASEGHDIQEAASGNLLVTGYAANYPGGFGQKDVILIEVDPTTLLYAGSSFHLYGTMDTDHGASVAEANPAAPGTPGFIIAGGTVNGPDYDLYLIKTDVNGSSFCNVQNPADVTITTNFTNPCYSVTAGAINQWCTPPYTADKQTWQNQFCYINPANRHEENPNDGTARAPETNPNDNVIAITDDATVASYPNPVRKGSTFKLDYSLARGGRVTIDVVDVAGKTVYTHTGDYPSGTSQIPVSTDGWPSGAYIVKLRTDGSSATQRVTVIDR